MASTAPAPPNLLPASPIGCRTKSAHSFVEEGSFHFTLSLSYFVTELIVRASVSAIPACANCFASSCAFQIVPTSTGFCFPCARYESMSDLFCGAIPR